MVLLDDSSPCALAVDPRTPASASKLSAELTTAWPRLEGRVILEARPLAEVAIAPHDVVVSAHACGRLTDDVLAAAVAASAPVAVLPCCHEVTRSALTGWLDGALAIDVARAQRLELAGYVVHTQTIDAAITPKHRLLIGVPGSASR